MSQVDQQFLEMSKWRMGVIHLSQDTGVVELNGPVYRGIGLHFDRACSLWDVIHLGSGHRLASLRGKIPQAATLGAKIAELGDWSFEGLDGWRNSDPQIIERLRALMCEHASEIKQYSASISHAGARRVVEARLGG